MMDELPAEWRYVHSTPPRLWHLRRRMYIEHRPRLGAWDVFLPDAIRMGYRMLPVCVVRAGSLLDAVAVILGNRGRAEWCTLGSFSLYHKPTILPEDLNA